MPTKKPTRKIPTETEITEMLENLHELIEECEKLQKIARELSATLTPPPANTQLVNLIELLHQDIAEERIRAELRNYRTASTPKIRVRKDFE